MYSTSRCVAFCGGALAVRPRLTRPRPAPTGRRPQGPAQFPRRCRPLVCRPGELRASAGSSGPSSDSASVDTDPQGSQPAAAAPAWRATATGLLYVAFVVHNFGFGPGSLADPGTIGLILQGATDEVNDLVIAMFYALGGIAAVYAGLLMPAAGRQTRLNTLAFSIAGCLLGFFGVGPYLAARDYAPAVSAEEVREQGAASQFFEGKVFAVSALLFSLYVYTKGLGLLAPAEMRDVIFYSSWQDTAHLFATDRGVHVTVLDEAVLCTLMWGPLTEDMRRRGWVFDGKNASSYVNALCILAAPCLGPALYLVLRPSLPPSRVDA
jgi:hypothetical protein